MIFFFVLVVVFVIIILVVDDNDHLLQMTDAAQKPGSIGWLVGASTASNAIVKNLSRAALIAEEATNMIVEK